MGELVFIEPHESYKISYVEGLKEGLELEPYAIDKIRNIEENFDGWLKDSNDLTRPVIMPDGRQFKRVPQKNLWLVNGTRFIGRVAIRAELSEALRELGGNIGYAVRASERRKGYGHLLLKKGMEQAKLYGLEKALVTCNDDNQGSIRIIEAAGGVLQDTLQLPHRNVPHRRYWITL